MQDSILGFIDRGVKVKRCNYCGRLLEASEFNRNRANADGLQRKCRECQHADNRRRASVFGYAQYNRYIVHGRYADGR